MPNKLYKYLDHQWLNNFFKNGEIKIGTLLDFQNVERYGSLVGDRDEGLKKVVLKSDEYRVIDPSVDTVEAKFLNEMGIFFEGDNKVITSPGTKLISNRLSPNFYTFCTSSRFAPEEMTGYGDSCYEISDAAKYFADISAELCLQRKVVFEGFHPIKYCNREFDYRNPGSDNPALIKDVGWRNDSEVRAVWRPLDEIQEKFIIINAPKARRWCRILSYKRSI